MARLRTTIVVCDICGDRDKPALRYTISFPGDGTKRFDLCEDDAAGLEYLREVKPTRSSRRVYSAQEVDELKGGHKTAKKVAKKK